MTNKFKHAEERLTAAGIGYQAISGGKQFIVDPAGLRISFWPGSGKFYAPTKSKLKPTTGLNGVADLINYVRANK